MKRSGILYNLLSIVLSFIILWSTVGVVNGQEVVYDITEANITGEISANGNVSFQDIYTYDVDFMNGAYYILDYSGYNLSSYQVGILDEETGTINYLTENVNQTPGTYRTSDDGELLTIQVFYPGENEEIHFVYEYTLDGLITNYNDTAELNRRIVGENWDENFAVNGVIYLPGQIDDPEQFRVWGHGHYAAEIYPVSEGNRSFIEVTVPNNPANQFVEVHAIFPTSLTPNNSNVNPVDMREQIIQAEEEQVQVDREAFESRRNRRWLMVGLLTVAFPLVTGFAWWYYLHHRKRLNPDPAMIPEHVYYLPEDITPALMATSMFRKTPTADDFSATIVDLARKNYITLEEADRETRGIFSRKSSSTVLVSAAENRPDYADLQKHERYVYEYLLPNDEPITLSQIEENIKGNKNVRKQKNRKWRQFLNYTEVRGEQLRQIPREQSAAQRWAVISLIMGAVLPVIGILLILDTPLMPYIWYFVGIFAVNVLAAIVLLIMTMSRPVRTYEEDKRRKEWIGFRNMLDNIGNFNMRDIASLPLWEEFLSYAISLDVADKVLEAMNNTYGVEELEQSMHMPLVFYNNPYWINSVIRPTVAQSISTAAPSQSSSSYSGSNTGGFGGGFSGGSSGGSGGGGGGGGF